MKFSETPESVLIEPDSPADACVIWLHGLGADGNDFVPIVPHMGLAKDAAIRFVFPHADHIPVTINGGMTMRAWYDILSLDRNGLQDEQGIRRSQARVEQLISEQIGHGIAAERIVLAGFSQGGAITLQTALRLEQKIAGILALSTYLPLGATLPSERKPANQDTPILMCHGEHDPVLPVDLGESSRDQLRELGYSVEWIAYPMAHEVCMDQITRIGQFLGDVLA